MKDFKVIFKIKIDGKKYISKPLSMRHDIIEGSHFQIDFTNGECVETNDISIDEIIDFQII